MIFDDDRAIAEVRLVRPEVRNAQTMSTWASLTQAAEIIAGRSDVAVVVLRGAGEDFSAGLDLRMMRGTGLAGEGDLGELARRDDTELERAIADFQQAFVCWRELSPIVVAVITGHAIGAGFQLALAADHRVLRDDAVLVMAEARLGLVPDLGGTRRLVELVGYARALEICATALPVDAKRAERLGLANALLAADEFEAGLERFLGTLLAIDPVVTRSVKTLLAHATTATPAEQLMTERRTQLPLLRGISGSSG